MGFMGRKKSIHNLLTEGFSVRVLVCGPIPLSAALSRSVFHNAILSNDLLCI